MRREKIEAEVEFRPKGLSELKAKWTDFAGDLLEPVVMLAAGATKAQAAWAGLRGVFESRVLGPLGLVAGASIGFLATTRLLVNQWRQLGMTGAATLERMTLQFRPLLGSIERAKERVRELNRFAVKTPFELGEVVSANKMLETLTQGALSTVKGMTLVGDAASVAGQSFEGVAQWVGRLYDGLMSGRPVGEAAMRLQEMGIISGTVRNQIESMQAANADGLDIWRQVEKQLQRNSGAMEEQSRTLEGLQSTYADTKNQMEAGFSSGFLEGEKAGIQSSIALMEAMTPVMKSLGDETGNLESQWEKLKLKVVEGVTGWRGFGTTVEWVIKGVVGLAAVLAGASVAALGAFGVKLLMLVAGNKAAAQSAEYLAKVEAASIPAKQKLVAVKGALVAAQRAHAAGLRAEAVESLTAAAAGLRNLAATNGMVGAVGAGRKAMSLFGLAIGFVGTQLRAMAVAILANPMVWLAAVVAGVGAAFSKWSAVQRETQERLEGLKKATSSLDSGLGKQISDIRTLVDLRQAEAKILSELVGAYKALDDAQNTDERKAAGERVDMLKDKLKSLPNAMSLERTDVQNDRERASRAGEEQRRQYERDSMAAKGPEEAYQVTLDRLEEINRRRREAIALETEEEASAARAAEARKNTLDSEARRQAMLAREVELKEKIAGYEAADKSTPDFGINEALAKPYRKELEELQKDLEAMRIPDNASLGEMLASASELQQVKAKIAVLDELKAATDAVAAAQNDLNQNTDESRKAGLKTALASAVDARKRAERMAAQAGLSDAVNNPRARQDLVNRRDELEARRTEDLDPMRQAEAEKARRDAELALATARVDAEEAIAGIRLRGYEREQTLLELEQRKLDLWKKAEAIGREEYDRQSQMIAERRRATEREAWERRTDLASALEISILRREEADSRLSGDTKRADRMRIAAEAREDARVRMDAEREAREAAATPQERANYVGYRVAEARTARESERRRAEEERALGRGRDMANQDSGMTAIRAEVLRRQGRTGDARRITEEAARRQDELDRRENQRRYRERGFTGGEADRMADRDVRLSRANRLLEQLGRGGGSVVADSLASVAGGGGVSGRDEDTDLLRRIEQVLRSIDRKSGQAEDFMSKE